MSPAYGLRENSMNMKEIRAIAKAQGVKPLKRAKADLIKSIQLHEGNFDCFASAQQQTCSQSECLWRDDCFGQATKAA